MERIFEAADQTSRLLFEDGLKNMGFFMESFRREERQPLWVTGVIALLMILFGAKCKYVLFAIQGFLLGVTAGLTASWFLHLEGWVMIGVSAGAGLVLAAFEAVFRKFWCICIFFDRSFCKCGCAGRRRRLSGTWNRRRRGCKAYYYLPHEKCQVPDHVPDTWNLHRLCQSARQYNSGLSV